MSKKTSASFNKNDFKIDRILRELELNFNQKIFNFLKTLLALRQQQENTSWNYMEIQISLKRYQELNCFNKIKRPFSDKDDRYLVVESLQENKKQIRPYPMHDSDGKVIHVLNKYGKKGWEVYAYDVSEKRFYLRRKDYLSLSYYRVLVSDSEINSLLGNVYAQGDYDENK